MEPIHNNAAFVRSKLHSELQFTVPKQKLNKMSSASQRPNLFSKIVELEVAPYKSKQVRPASVPNADATPLACFFLDTGVMAGLSCFNIGAYSTA